MSIRRKYSEEALQNDAAANCGRPYQQCAASVMDTIHHPEIEFDESGSSQYPEIYDRLSKQLNEGEAGKAAIEGFVQEMKAFGKGKKYDCLLGVSGGVDSTYLALVAKRLGLRVLCVHFDNGWNSELAVQNINNIIDKCGFDLQTYVIDWPEFKDIQLAYFKAGVIDIEAVTDIAIFAALDKVALETGARYILDGRNVQTECIMPSSWFDPMKSAINLINIHEKFGEKKLINYPLNKYSIRKNKPKRLTSIPFLQSLDYDKTLAKREIASELGWRDYGGKHYESVFTRFYQGYILPEKFGVDKRKAHLSNLIFSGQMSKDEAIMELKSPIYSQEQLEIDFPFALKKLGFTEQEFYEYIDAPRVEHGTYHYFRPFWWDLPLVGKWLKLAKK